MERTKEGLNGVIWSKVQGGLCIHDAVVAVQAEIAADPAELAAWWEVLGIYWLKETERDGRRLDSQPLAIPDAASGWTPPKNYGKSWRDNVDPLSIVVSVGCSGVQKPAGDLTREDVAVCVDFHRSSAESHVHRQQQWLRVHNAMKDGETIRLAARRRPKLFDGDMPWIKRAQKEEAAASAA